MAGLSTLVAGAVVCASCLIGLWRYAAVRSSQRWLRARPAPSVEDCTLPVLVLVPAYEEQHRLPGLADQLLAMRYPRDHLRVLFITSAGERPPADGSPDTAAVAEDQAHRLNAACGRDLARHVRCPAVPTSMAVQLNYGLTLARQSGWSTRDSYVCVLAADAYLDPDAFAQMVGAARRWWEWTGRMPGALQQPTTHLRTFAALGHGFADQVRRAAGVYQSTFSLGVELPVLRRNAGRRRRRQRLPRWRYSPLSGHGLYLSAELLTRHGGFPTETWCEDISLSIAYHCLDVPVVPVPSVERNESPLVWPVYVSQARTWFTGATQVRMMSAFARRVAASRRGLGRALLYRTWLSLCWLGGPLLLCAAFTTILLDAGPAAAAAAAVAWAAAHYLSQRPVWRWCRAGGRRPVREAAASALFYLGIAPLGPLASLVTRLPLARPVKAKARREELREIPVAAPE